MGISDSLGYSSTPLLPICASSLFSLALRLILDLSPLATPSSPPPIPSERTLVLLLRSKQVRPALLHGALYLVGSVGTYIEEITAVLAKKSLSTRFAPNSTDTTATMFFEVRQEVSGPALLFAVFVGATPTRKTAGPSSPQRV